MECSRGVAQFACLVLLCFVGIPIWLEAPIRLPPGLVEKKFRNFISKYNKTYGNGEHPEEFQKRLGIFTVCIMQIGTCFFIALVSFNINNILLAKLQAYNN